MNRLPVRITQVLALITGLALAAMPALAFAQTTDDGGLIALFGGTVGCVCALIGFIIQIAITYWVYNDAKKNGNPNAVLWGVLTFFFTLIGLILYLVIGRNQGTTGTPGGAARM
jgi:hypothetical protein